LVTCASLSTTKEGFTGKATSKYKRKIRSGF
jgi:hypothetical protein